MKYYYTYNCSGIDDNIYKAEFDSLDDLLTSTSKSICFSDCVPITILSIVADDKNLVYTGWQPNMTYTYKEVGTNNIVWEMSFPEWEH